jgi:YD repeat-containing protein
MPRMSRLLLTLIAIIIIAMVFVMFAYVSANAQTRERHYDKRGHLQGYSIQRGDTTRHYDSRGHLKGTTKSTPPRRQ